MPNEYLTFLDLLDIREAPNAQIKSASAIRKNQESPSTEPGTANFTIGIELEREALVVVLKAEVENNAVSLEATGSISTPLPTDWRCKGADMDNFVQIVCIPAIYPVVRQAISIQNYLVGMPKLGLPTQLIPFQSIGPAYKPDEVLEYKPSSHKD